jgi:hypothetical protein
MASQFWDQETDAAERNNKTLRLIIERVTPDDGRIVSVTPRTGSWRTSSAAARAW